MRHLWPKYDADGDVSKLEPMIVHEIILCYKEHKYLKKQAKLERKIAKKQRILA